MTFTTWSGVKGFSMTAAAPIARAASRRSPSNAPDIATTGTSGRSARIRRIVEALEIGHHHVGQQQVHAATFAQAHGLEPSARLQHVVPRARQGRGQQQSQPRLVVGHDDSPRAPPRLKAEASVRAPT